VRIEGPSGGTGFQPVVLLNRNNASLGSFAIHLTGGDDVTLSNLDITGAEYGIVALSGADSDRLLVTNSRIRGNAQKGLYVSSMNDDLLVANSQIYDNPYGGIYVEYASGATIRDNVVYNTTLGNRGIELFSPASATATGNESYGHGAGIFASNSGTGSVTVSNNNVHDNRDFGIDAGTNVQVIGNTVSRTRTGFGSGTGGPLGIKVTSGSVARDNTVFDNIRGIQAFDSTAINNRVFHNDLVGISGHFAAQLLNNTVYSNGVGIFTQNFTGRIANNLVYDNSNDGIWLAGGNAARIEGNTIYQATTGDAVQVGGPHPEFFTSNSAVTNTQFTNNILRVGEDYAIHVAADSQAGMTSDYNDFVLAGTGKLGRWEGTDFTTREDWFHELGLDGHGIFADPQFIDFDGADNILGYDVANNVDRGLDDDFRVGATSPTIDAGHPLSGFVGEPAPNGQRVNLGHTGDTALAATSAEQSLQVLSPNGGERFEAGTPVTITWQSAGLTLTRAVALIDAGGAGAENWLADKYKVAGTIFSFTTPVDTSNVTNPAPASTYQVGTYGGFGAGNRVAYQLPVTDGSYSLRLHFVEPGLGAGQRP
ncbi:MAG TPA: right-handed parallel beta-helix repeat-containing protein, partial [Pirellulaceae bacterium]